MPKSSCGKKRKSEKCKEGTGQKPKKVKRNGKSVENDKRNSKEGKNSKEEVARKEPDDDCSKVELDIDEELDKNAQKSNLSVFNVKSILHHVLSDERVVALACKAAEDGEQKDDTPGDDQNEKNLESAIPNLLEPKLTRSRFREVAQTTGTNDPLLLVKETIIHSPLKKVVSPLKIKKKKLLDKQEIPKKHDDGEEVNAVLPEVQIPLVNVSFSEEAGSSDEEYHPLKELSDGSEEETESCISNVSDLSSPQPLRRTSRCKRQLLTDLVTSPERANVDQSEKCNASVSEETTSPFKAPASVPQKNEKRSKAKTDLIATRTRSRLPLTDTSIESLEAQFVPPDLPADLYDIISLEDLEPDDIDWHKWLCDLNNEKVGSTDAEDPEDTEYNFMAEDQKEEQEEYRNDRAVKVSLKELTELLEELFTESGDEIHGFNANSRGLATGENVSENGDAVVMTSHQKQRVIKQLQKHTQLLVQVALLSKQHPALKSEGELCQNFLQELIQRHGAASTHHASDSLEKKIPSPSVFSHIALPEAVRIMNLPCAAYNFSTAVALPQTNAEPGEQSRESPVSAPIPEAVKQILVSSPVFMFSELLPHVAFGPKKKVCRGSKFLQCEDNLLVLGIDQYGYDWSLIRKNYLPVKTFNQIKIRRKNLCSNRCPNDNVLKQFKRTGRVPVLPKVPAVPACEDRPRIILPAKSPLDPSRGSQKTQENESVKKKKVAKKKKAKIETNVAATAVDDISPPAPSALSTTTHQNAAPSISDSHKETEETCESLDETKEDALCEYSNVDESSNLDRLEDSWPEEKIRTFFPNITLSATVEEYASTNKRNFKQSEIVDTEYSWSRERDVIPSDNVQYTLLQSSEKENIQPSCKETHGESLVECNHANSVAAMNNGAWISDRALAIAQSYLNNVKKEVDEDSPTYQAFLKVLVDSKSNLWTPTKLYREVAVVLKDFPPLVRGFIAFLEPHQALDAGVFMESRAIVKARTFLKHVENHFQKNASHFQKIIKAFATFSLQNSRSDQLYEVILPLLKGQQHLVEEFNSFFDHLKPRPSLSDDFEEVELGSGSEFEVDDFEEIVIPDVKKNVTRAEDLGKGLGKTSFRNTSSSKKLRKFKKVGKIRRNVSTKNIVDDGKVDGGDVNEDKVGEQRPEGLAGTLEDKDEDYDEKTWGTDEDEECERGSKRASEFTEDLDENCDKKLSDTDDEDEEFEEKVNSDDENQDFGTKFDDTNALSPLIKYGSDVSNPSSPDCETRSGDIDYPFDGDDIESPETANESHVTSASEDDSDYSNEVCDLPTTSKFDSGTLEPCSSREITEPMENPDTGLEITCVKSSYERRNLSEKGIKKKCGVLDNSGRNAELAMEMENKKEVPKKKENLDDFSPKISANNLEVDKDGKSVIVWTREDDKKILELYQSKGMSNDIYEQIAGELGNKTAAQVEGRFRILVNLLTGENIDNVSSEEYDSECDNESCDEDVKDK